jgi:hypothetical protein
MNKYRFLSSNLTLFTNYFEILIPKVNNLSFVNIDSYAKVSPRRCGRIHGTAR